MMDESEQRMFDQVKEELAVTKMDEEALLESLGALQSENEALWKLLEAIRKRLEHLR